MRLRSEFLLENCGESSPVAGSRMLALQCRHRSGLRSDSQELDHLPQLLYLPYLYCVFLLLSIFSKEPPNLILATVTPQLPMAFMTWYLGHWEGGNKGDFVSSLEIYIFLFNIPISPPSINFLLIFTHIC